MPAPRRPTGDILLFLHGDTRLPSDADHVLLKDSNVQAAPGAASTSRSTARDPLLRIVAWFMNLRSRLTGIATGDQAIFVKRDAFKEVGGFPPIALMEDIALSKRLKRVEPAALPARTRRHLGPALGEAWRDPHHPADVASAARLFLRRATRTNWRSFTAMAATEPVADRDPRQGADPGLRQDAAHSGARRRWRRRAASRPDCARRRDRLCRRHRAGDAVGRARRRPTRHSRRSARAASRSHGKVDGDLGARMLAALDSAQTARRWSSAPIVRR